MQNFPTTATYGTSWDGAISSSYMNFIKKFIKLATTRIREGWGLGVASGFREWLRSIASLAKIKWEFLERDTLIINNGQNTLVAADITNIGYFMQFEIAYQL